MIIDWNAAAEWALLMLYFYGCFWFDGYLRRLYWGGELEGGDNNN